MPFPGKSPDPNPCMPFIANIYFLVRALEIPVVSNVRSEINIYKAQSTMSFLSNSLKALVTRTVTNGFPSVTPVLQHLVFKMSFHDVHFPAPRPLTGGDEKVILIFQRSPVNYSTGLCIAYSLH